jgi:hypothetical protein
MGLHSSWANRMNWMPLTRDMDEIPRLLHGDAERMDTCIQRSSPGRVVLYLAIIFAGAGLFGAAVGCWRGQSQAAYTAVKLPLILLLTTLGNALLNGMLAPLLGLNISFRQSFLAILMSFTIAAAVLASLSPVLFFLVWNMPPLERISSSRGAYSFILLAQVLMIAFAGTAANFRLIQLLRRLSGSAAVARKILFGWLLGNLLLGAQLSWNLRPFVGSPGLPVEFLRNDAFQGNFFEAVFHAARHLLFP